jgi:[acyl-carrier-protein] S-malonyltransferase
VADKEAALVICPGRGTYGKAELGYLKRLHGDKGGADRTFDRLRAERGQPTLSELDGAERFSVALHTRGDIASPLIFAAPMPISSPSTGRASTSPRSPAIRWAGTRRSPAPARSSAEHGFRIVDAMGENSQAGEPGGQVLLTLVDEDWRPMPGLRDAVLLVEAIGAARSALHVSIDLGGMLVFAGNEAGLAALSPRRRRCPAASRCASSITAPSTAR